MSLFVIACGGTGGHLSPGIALAEALQARGQECLLIVSRKKVDGKLLEKYPHLRFRRAPGTGFSWRPVPFLRFVASQSQAVWFAARLVLERRPAAYVSFGGFMTLGMAVVCRLLGVPVVLHEANRVPGKAVRVLSRIATRVWLPPGVGLRGLTAPVLRHAGFPVRREILPVPRAEARRALGLPETGRLLLLLGGSQGAAPLNAWARENFPKIAGAGAHVLCVTGPGKAAEAEPLCATDTAGAERVARFVPFCDQMAEALSAADLVVSRAGAGSIAEITACGVPAVLVPFPQSADGHQAENAWVFEQDGGGVVIAQKDLATLTDEVTAILSDDWLRGRFQENLSRMREQNDWRVMVDDLLALGGVVSDPSQREVPA